MGSLSSTTLSPLAAPPASLPKDKKKVGFASLAIHTYESPQFLRPAKQNEYATNVNGYSLPPRKTEIGEVVHEIYDHETGDRDLDRSPLESSRTPTMIQPTTTKSFAVETGFKLSWQKKATTALKFAAAGALGGATIAGCFGLNPIAMAIGGAIGFAIGAFAGLKHASRPQVAGTPRPNSSQYQSAPITQRYQHSPPQHRQVATASRKSSSPRTEGTYTTSQLFQTAESATTPTFTHQDQAWMS